MRILQLFITLSFIVLLSPTQVQAQSVDPATIPISELDAQNLINQAWAANAQGQTERLDTIVAECTSRYKEKAIELQTGLTEFPNVGQKDIYQPLNDLGTCFFIQSRVGHESWSERRSDC